jgi:hypothetical protein
MALICFGHRCLSGKLAHGFSLLVLGDVPSEQAEGPLGRVQSRTLDVRQGEEKAVREYRKGLQPLLDAIHSA